jgi:hypothetical protein
MFHDHLNPYVANEHARARMAEMESSIARQATDRRAPGASRCRPGKHSWRCRGRGDILTYVCLVCGKTREKPPRRRWGAAQVPGGAGGGPWGYG